MCLICQGMYKNAEHHILTILSIVELSYSFSFFFYGAKNLKHFILEFYIEWLNLSLVEAFLFHSINIKSFHLKTLTIW